VVNVTIDQFQPGGAVVDAAALVQFQDLWATYGELVERRHLKLNQIAIGTVRICA
jgi:hypothetical protein